MNAILASGFKALIAEALAYASDCALRAAPKFRFGKTDSAQRERIGRPTTQNRLGHPYAPTRAINPIPGIRHGSKCTVKGYCCRLFSELQY
jgi:hypothetical protein